MFLRISLVIVIPHSSRKFNFHNDMACTKDFQLSATKTTPQLARSSANVHKMVTLLIVLKNICATKHMSYILEFGQKTFFF